jgi:hypothetical protein
VKLTAGQAWRALVTASSLGAAALSAHSALNLALMRRPAAHPEPVRERVSVLLPVRDEEHRAGPCIASLRAQELVDDLEILVLDDGSQDGTARVVDQAADGDPRVRLLAGTPLPPGWLGKPHACHQLAQAATGSVLVFVDADVRFAPDAVAAAVHLLREHRLSLVSPYPRQLAVTVAERLVQPLLQWSWLTTLPLRLAERSSRPSMAAANGQFLVVDAGAYRLAGGHGAIRDAVLDDLALLRAIMAAGGTGGVADGTRLAVCRMYDDWPGLREGYRKSLWSAFGSPAGAAGAVGMLVVLYVVPPVAALTGSPTGLAGYLAAVAGRVAVARRTGGAALPDSLAHPVSILALGWLTASSLRGRRRGDLTWRGRGVRPEPRAAVWQER